MPELEDEIRSHVLEQIDLRRQIADEEVRSCVRREIRTLGKRQPIPIEERKRLERSVFNSLRKLDVLQELLENDDITEIMINGPDRIFVEERGQIRLSGRKFSSVERLNDVIQQIASMNNEIINETSPILDTRINGERVCIVLPPVGIDYPILSIRKFPKEPITMAKLLSYQSISPEIAEFLEKAVKARYNIFISGGTSSGKTTFLNALTEFIPPDQRIVTIEDSAELKLLGIPNLIRLESRNKTLEGKLEITIRDLVKTSLRLRPDRIIVGECRGGETLDMIQAMASGHPGSISTGHANSAMDMISRIETMVLMASGVDLPLAAVRSQIASGIDLIIHLGRLKDRSRRLIEIAEVDGVYDGEIRLHSLYKLRQPGGAAGSAEPHTKESEAMEDNKRKGGDMWEKTGGLRYTEKMEIAGFRSW